MTRSFDPGGRPLPSLVALAFAQITDALTARVREGGYDDLELHHLLNVFRFLEPGGVRPARLAELAGVTPQAMSLVLRDLEARGYVRRDPDPTDRRASVVVWSDRGREAAGLAEAWLADVERRWVREFGAARVDAAREVLAAVVERGVSA